MRERFCVAAWILVALWDAASLVDVYWLSGLPDSAELRRLMVAILGIAIVTTALGFIAQYVALGYLSPIRLFRRRP